MMGQLATWLLELSYMLIITVFLSGTRRNRIREIVSVAKLSEFVLIPIIQMYTSPPLRKFILGKSN